MLGISLQCLQLFCHKISIAKIATRFQSVAHFVVKLQQKIKIFLLKILLQSFSKNEKNPLQFALQCH